MARFFKTVDRIADASGAVAGAMVCLGLLLVLVEIWMRSVHDSTIYVAEEYSGYLMAMLTFLGLSYTMKEKGHIRMTFLLRSLQSPARRRLRKACHLVALVFSCLLLYFTALFFWDSVVNESQSMQISETYLAIPQFFLPLGAGVLALQYLAGLLRPSSEGGAGTEETDEEESDFLGR